MLRLTVREAATGRLLGRIVQRDGATYVLDHGDPEFVADAAQRTLQGGFVVRWGGSRQRADPTHAAVFQQLALHYLAQGHLVAVDEPTWGSVPRAVPTRPRLAVAS